MDIRHKRDCTARRLGIAPERIPDHIAVIMDGNGRWARQRGKNRALGHMEGANNAERIARHCSTLGIRALTLYAFSMENWKRPRLEISTLMRLCREYLVRMRPVMMDDNVRMVHLGRRDPLPQALLDEIDRTLEETANNDGLLLGLALNYGSRTEIVDAVRQIAHKARQGAIDPEAIDQACISQHLYTAPMPDPDLLIRTAGEMRVSNFLLWQISYSELYVTDLFWPDFDDHELEKAIVAYARRDRRFGGLLKGEMA